VEIGLGNLIQGQSWSCWWHSRLDTWPEGTFRNCIGYFVSTSLWNLSSDILI
jgi:hypothetical protein